MAAPFRIKKSRDTEQVSTKQGDDFKSYLERLLKMIPGEVVGLYLVGSGVIPKEHPIILVGWSIICLVAVIVVRVYGTTDPEKQLPPEWPAVVISTVAFVIWVYTIGGPFKEFKVGDTELHQPYIGSLLVLIWTFFVPIFYKDK